MISSPVDLLAKITVSSSAKVYYSAGIDQKVCLGVQNIALSDGTGS